VNSSLSFYYRVVVDRSPSLMLPPSAVSHTKFPSHVVFCILLRQVSLPDWLHFHIPTPTACLLQFFCHLYLGSSAFPTLGFPIFPPRWVTSPSSNPNLQYRGLPPPPETALCITKNWNSWTMHQAQMFCLASLKTHCCSPLPPCISYSFITPNRVHP
jgi:hypothetical protein